MTEANAGYAKDWDGLWVPVKRFAQSISSATTDGNLVTAVAAKRIRVLTLEVSPGAAVTTVTLNSKGSGAGTAISAAMALGASSTAAWPYHPHGHLLTNAGEALTATTSASGVATAIHGTYIESSEP